MDEAKSQDDEFSRRRSMLPQKAPIKPFSKPMGSFAKQGSFEARVKCPAHAENQATAVLQAAQNKVAMLPPSKTQPYANMRPPAGLRQTSSKPDSVKIGHTLRQPSTSSTSRKLSRDHSADGVYPSQKFRDFSEPYHPQGSASSGKPDPQSNAREPYHGRSLSQQVRPTATSDHLHSKAFPQRQSSMKHARPAFSAMQQHFSPKKNIQPDPSTQPTTKDASPSADIVQLQMEMAQLHLLHRSVASVQAQWEKSAKGSFEYRFSALYERHIELKEIALQQQTLINQLSLVHWSQGRSGAQIVEKVQLLSQNVSDICNLLDSEGKYTHILEIFESWFAQALRVRAQRESNGQEPSRDLTFIEGIGDGWKAEAMVLERELTYSARDLESFGEISSTSSLCRILSMYRKLVTGLLEELDLIQWIETEIMSRETLWIESEIHNLASNISKNIGIERTDRKAI